VSARRRCVRLSAPNYAKRGEVGAMAKKKGKKKGKKGKKK